MTTAAALAIVATPATASVLIGDHHAQKFTVADPSKLPAGALAWTFSFDKDHLREVARTGTKTTAAALTVAGDQAGSSTVHAELTVTPKGGAPTVVGSADVVVDVPAPSLKGGPTVTIGAKDKTADKAHLQPWDWLYAWYDFDNVSKTTTNYYFTSWLEHGAVGLVQDDAASKLMSPGKYRLAMKATNQLGPASATPLFKPGGTPPARAVRAAAPVATAITEIAASSEAMGKHVADGMAKANSSTSLTAGIWYPEDFEAECAARGKPELWKEAYRAGHANPAYWTAVPGTTWQWQLNAGASASAGIKAWLAGLTITECESVVVALQIDAVRAAIGDDKFDAKFGSASGPVPATPLRVGKGALNGKHPITAMMSLTDAAKAKDPGKPGARPIAVGEAAYFANYSTYYYKHPMGAWIGENVVYLGLVAGEQRWSGFGAQSVTEKELIRTMIGRYNEPRAPIEEAKSAKPGGGYIHPLLDPKSFPDTIDEKAFAGDPGGLVPDGAKAPRFVTGGFDAERTLRIDAAKVTALRDSP
jgi:hypothetical protein